MSTYRRRRSSVPWFRASGYGTIYLMQSMDDPRLIKIGFTQRRTMDRRAELEEDAGGRLKIVYTLSMPHAYQVEQRVLSSMRKRFFGRGDIRGTEWFRMRPWDSLEGIKRRMSKAALHIRFVAVWKLAWPFMGDIRVFNPAHRRRNGPKMLNSNPKHRNHA